MSTQTHITLLGHKVQDKVTGFTGVVTSVAFDLYGCIQAVVHPGLQQDGKLGDQTWFDVNRLEILSREPVMHQPDYGNQEIARGDKGPAEKPAAMKA